MTRHVHHDLKLAPSRDELARQDFVSALRVHVLHDMAASMKRHYEAAVKPRHERQAGTAPQSSGAVHDALKSELYFQFYSGLRVNAQEMVWDSVRPTLERQRPRLTETARRLGADGGKAQGTLELDPALAAPSNVTAVDVHLMPGSYHSEYGPDDLSGGALYDHGLSVFSMGLMGGNLDDIGRSVAGFVRLKYPHFQPERILDMGCTIGHNSLPWKTEFPDAEVIGVDVAAPGLRYAHARAQSQGVTAHFRQADAAATGFADASFDVVFSSMFLHELPKKTIAAVMAEAHRLLRPGGLMIHMELPPNTQMNPYDGFYLDWDCFYNNEPFYKAFRDINPESLCTAAGFDADNYVQVVIPSREGYGEATFRAAAQSQGAVDSETTGRLADGIQWFAFGAFK